MARMVEASIINSDNQAGHENVGGGFKFEEWEQMGTTRQKAEHSRAYNRELFSEAVNIRDGHA